ncbi:TetR/AcrR family transcriptional regulator [Actinocorallia herbida]|uniref:TetR/AcrR family transcriptional regulator n=1 Tax=Actinocorallia herbida TaxID=58109 RepID=UPI0024832684|nr:TetR family transcriptional regulator [Actinocorallia herbida]
MNEDLTAKARIRDAALAEFARHGVKGTTVRGVAEAAGVSAGLVQHHFGTKEGLREACDSYALETVRRVKREAFESGMGDPGFMATAVAAGLPIQRYLARALVDGSPAAARLFDDAVAFSEQLLGGGAPGMAEPSTEDLHAYAAVMTAMNFGQMVLHEHLSRALGVDTLSTDGYRKVALAMLDINDDRLMSPELVAHARAALRGLPHAGADVR